MNIKLSKSTCESKYDMTVKESYLCALRRSAHYCFDKRSVILHHYSVKNDYFFLFL